jgi:GR25 family glycosyltransferase involved in LPS biosynthesis
MSIEAMNMALEFVEWLCGDDHSVKPKNSALKTREALRQAIEQAEKQERVDAVNMKQERVDETAKRKHEPWPSVQCVCGGTIYFKYTPPVSDYHEGWEEGFKAAKREWVGLTDEEARKFYEKYTNREKLIYAIDKFLEEKNNG